MTKLFNLKDGNFSAIPNVILDCPYLNARDKLVLIALVRVSYQSTTFEVSQRRLAKGTGHHPDTVSAAIDSLSDLGLLIRHDVKKGQKLKLTLQLGGIWNWPTQQVTSAISGSGRRSLSDLTARSEVTYPLGHIKETKKDKEFQANDIYKQIPVKDESGLARIEPITDPAAELIECTATGNMAASEPRLAAKDWRYPYASFVVENALRTLDTLEPEEITTLCGLIAIRYAGAYSGQLCASDASKFSAELKVRLEDDTWNEKTISDLLVLCQTRVESDCRFLQSLEDLIAFDDLVSV